MRKTKNKFYKNPSLIFLFLVIFSNISIYANFFLNDNINNKDKDIIAQNADSGKIFDTLEPSSQTCYVNRYQPSLNTQPEVYIPEYYLSNADIHFSNIIAINYTNEIETKAAEFIASSSMGPLYAYQKFWVEIDQYVNNASVFIQDINNPYVYTDDNAWEVAITNCTNDGAPNATLGALKKPHPLNMAAHWEFFDFLNSKTGPIYLNTSNTNSTIEDGITKYWFSLRIKLPADDSGTGGGPKFLYFNLDGGDSSNKGVGETYANLPYAKKVNYIENYVNYYLNDTSLMNGSIIDGNISSFEEMDEDRFVEQSFTNNLTVALRIDICNYTDDTSYWDLFFFFRSTPALREAWEEIHYTSLFSIDFYLALNVSDNSIIDGARIYARNYTHIAMYGGDKWVPLDNLFNITQINENLSLYRMQDPWDKIAFFSLLNDSKYTIANNTFDIRIVYNTTGAPINVSINHYRIDMVFPEDITTVQKYDPLLQEQYYPTDENIINGTTSKFGNQALDLLELNDDKFYRVESDSNNLSIEFKANLVPYLDSSYWDVDYYDWQLLYPNPIIPYMDVRVSSNVSSNNPLNITTAILEVYKGDLTLDIWNEAENNRTWIPLSTETKFNSSQEEQVVRSYDQSTTWIIMQLLNTSDINSLWFRFRYSANNTFNVSIDEFSANLYIQNARSSDYVSKIGLGLDSRELQPSDIEMENFGTAITDGGANNGTWISDIEDGTPTMGYYTFNITSLWPSITFNAMGIYEVYKIKPKIQFVDNPDESYMTGEHVFTVEVTNHLGKPIENIEMIFEVLDIDGRVISDSTSSTNEDGIASASLDFEETGEGFSIRVRFSEEGIYTDSDVTSEEFRIDNELTLITNTLIRYSLFIAIALMAIATYIVVRHRKLNASRAKWAKEASVLNDLLKISHVMVIHKNLGVSLYSKQVSFEEIDSELISGFLHALSSFRKEFKKDTKGEGFMMDYYDFKISLTEGDFIRVALLLDSKPSENMIENQKAFTQDFEKTFWPYLENFTGDTQPFGTADDLVERYFNVKLIYPYRLAGFWEVKVDPLEDVLIDVAEQMLKEKKFLFISSLINYGIAGRKESRDHVVSAVLNLISKRVLEPIDIGGL